MGCACTKKKQVGYRRGEAVGWIVVDGRGLCALPVGDGCCRVFADEQSARQAAENAEITSVSFVSVMM